VTHPGPRRPGDQALQDPSQTVGLIEEVEAVGVVVHRVHLEVGIEDGVGLLPRPREMHLVPIPRPPAEVGPAGADLEGVLVEGHRAVVARLGEACPRAVAKGLGHTIGVPNQGREPIIGPRSGERRVHEAKRPGAEERGHPKPGLGPLGHDVDHPAQAALVTHVERALGYLDPVDLGKVDVERSGVHPVGARALDVLTIDEDGEVTLAETAHDDVVGDPPLAQLPDARHAREGFTHVLRVALTDARRLQGVPRSDAEDLDGFSDRRDREGDRDLPTLARLQILELGEPGLEARGDGGEVPAPGSDAGEAEDAALARRGETGLAPVGSREVERHSGKRGAVRGEHDTGEGGERRRNDRRAGRQRSVRTSEGGRRHRHRQEHQTESTHGSLLGHTGRTRAGTRPAPGATNRTHSIEAG
jgi:hypothetical protein